MGAWGTGPFENDDAGDFESTLSKDGKSLLEKTLFKFDLRRPNDESICSAAIAACEVIAAAAGHPMRGFAQVATEAHEWVKEERYQPPQKILDRANKVARAIQQSSYLLDLWREAGDLTSWKRTISSLIRRLEKPPKKQSSAKPKQKSSRPASKTNAASQTISTREAKQIVKKKLDGMLSETNKKSTEVYIDSVRKLSLKDAQLLASLPNVHSLIFDFVKVKADKLKPVENMLRGWTDLKNIRAGTTTGLAKTICQIASQLEQLSELDLSDSEATDSDIRLLSNSPSLQSINLGRTQITAKSLGYLSTMKQLKVVNLYKCDRLSIPAVNQFLDKSSQDLVVGFYPTMKQLGLKSLTKEQKAAFEKKNKTAYRLIEEDWSFVWINLLYGSLGFGQFVDLDRLQLLADECELDSLEIGQNQSAIRDETAEGLRSILQAWPNIRSLSITKSKFLDDSYADLFSRYRKLKLLSFHNVNISDTTLREITKLQGLVHLGLTGTRITRKSLVAIAKLPKLRWLRISPGQNITKQDLLKLRKKLLKTCYVQIV